MKRHQIILSPVQQSSNYIHRQPLKILSQSAQIYSLVAAEICSHGHANHSGPLRRKGQMTAVRFGSFTFWAWNGHRERGNRALVIVF